MSDEYITTSQAELTAVLTHDKETAMGVNSKHLFVGDGELTWCIWGNHHPQCDADKQNLRLF